MSIQISTQGFALTRSLEAYTLQNINNGFGNWLDRVGNVRVGLSDINGPKGGADKRCKLYIALPQQPDLVISEVQPDMYEAINHAVRRARQSLGRRLSRAHMKAKGGNALKKRWHSHNAAQDSAVEDSAIDISESN